AARDHAWPSARDRPGRPARLPAGPARGPGAAARTAAAVHPWTRPAGRDQGPAPAGAPTARPAGRAADRRRLDAAVLPAFARYQQRAVPVLPDALRPAALPVLAGDAQHAARIGQAGAGPGLRVRTPDALP